MKIRGSRFFSVLLCLALLPSLVVAPMSSCDQNDCQGQGTSSLCHCVCHLLIFSESNHLGLYTKQVVSYRLPEISPPQKLHVSNYFRPPQACLLAFQ